MTLAMPDLRAVPSPFGLVTALHLLTFALHLAAMGTLVGGIVTALAARGDVPASAGRPRLVAFLPVAMAATVTLGVAPLLFLQLSYGKVAYAAAVASAWFWLQVPLAAMVAYGALYAAAKRSAQGAGGVAARLAVALAAVLWVSVVYASTFSLAEDPAAIARLYAGSASGWRLHADVLAWGPRWAHTIALAVAVGAFAARIVARGDAAVESAARRVGLLAAVATAVAAGARALLDAGLLARLGGLGTLAFAAAALLPLAAAAGRPRRAVAGSALALAVVATVVARHVARLAALEGRFDPASAPVRPQHDVFAIFVVCLLVAVGVIAWMLRAWSRAAAGPAR